MADPPRYPDTGDDTGVRPTADRPPSTPRWVKVSGIVVIVVVLLVVAMMFAGGGGHGPGRHTPSGDAGGQTPPSSVTESGGGGGHTPPSSVMEDHAPPEGGRE